MVRFLPKDSLDPGPEASGRPCRGEEFRWFDRPRNDEGQGPGGIVSVSSNEAEVQENSRKSPVRDTY